MSSVFVTGATGYLGRHLIPALLERGHSVRALVRPGSESKLPAGSTAIVGDALNRATFQNAILPATTFIQLLGVPHPSPAKAAQFRNVDLVSVRESVAAALFGRVEHFIYVSVARPSPIMQAYVEVRAAGETMIRESGMNATFLRPLYVLGPGHIWPYALLPFYWLFERTPSKRDAAMRLGLVTLRQMIAALVEAVEHPAAGIRIVTVPDIRKAKPGPPGGAPG